MLVLVRVCQKVKNEGDPWSADPQEDSPLLELLERFACTLMLPATFIMIFLNTY